METLAATVRQPVSSGIFIEGVWWDRDGVPAWSRGPQAWPLPQPVSRCQACGQRSLTVSLSSDSVGVHSQGACAPEGGGGRRYSLLRKKPVESFLWAFLRQQFHDEDRSRNVL